MMKFELSQEFKDWRDSKPEHQEHVRKWAEALLTSKQYKTGLYDVNDHEKLCCLGVSCVVEGQTIDQMTLEDVGLPLGLPSQGISTLLKHIRCASAGDKIFRFDSLNDKHLTHPQISQLLTEGYVEVGA